MTATVERRRRRASLRLTARERTLIETAAGHAGLCLSDYLRRVVLGAPPLRARRRPPPEFHLAARLLVQLGAIPSVLRAIAQGLPEPLTPFVERDLARALLELRHCRTGLMKFLGRRRA